MASENTTDMGAFFAKKKGKKKFGSKKKSPATNIAQTLAAEVNPEKEKRELDSGWVDNVEEEKKAIINTSGKSVVDLSDDKTPIVKENKETGNKFNMEETKNIFQSARASAQQKGDTEEVKEPVKKLEEMTWKEKMEMRKKSSTGPIKVNDERHFPTLGGKSSTAETAGGAWGTFVTSKDDTEGEGQDAGEEGDAEATNED